MSDDTKTRDYEPTYLETVTIYAVQRTDDWRWLEPYYCDSEWSESLQPEMIVLSEDEALMHARDCGAPAQVVRLVAEVRGVRAVQP